MKINLSISPADQMETFIYGKSFGEQKKALKLIVINSKQSTRMHKHIKRSLHWLKMHMMYKAEASCNTICIQQVIFHYFTFALRWLSEFYMPLSSSSVVKRFRSLAVSG